MRSTTRFSVPTTFPFAIAAFLAILWLAGGSSRGDATGQIVVRTGASLMMIFVLVFGERRVIAPKAVLVLLVLALGLALAQLVPLPSTVWEALPGRDPFVQAGALTGDLQPWRPLAIVPGAAINAAAALIVPFAALVSISGLRPSEQAWLPGLLLGFVAAAALVGLIQASGVQLRNPLVDGTTGVVSGTFANRNHFATLLAMGCLLAPAWAFRDGHRPSWRLPAAVGLILLFTLTILAIGSRAGLLAGALAIGIGWLITREQIRREFIRAPRWVFPAITAGLAAIIVVAVLISIAAQRAEAIDRIFALDTADDMRRRGLPTVLAMIGQYFPFGSGLGGFDPVFRMREPFDLLKPTYFNNAHNDYFEVALSAGMPGVILLAATLLWWGRESIRVWRAKAAATATLPRVGSAMLLLVIVASMFDYPARTPTMMFMIVIAAMWLGDRSAVPDGSALPARGRDL